MRKTKTITLNDGGSPLTFKITQMPATKMERWINRVIMLLAKGGQDAFKLGSSFSNSKDAKETTMEIIKTNGIKGILKMVGAIDYEEIEPLYDELLTCCARVVDNFEQPCTKESVDGFISEVKTLYLLRFEVLKLNFDFFMDVGNSPTQDTEKAAITFSKITRT